MKFRNIVAHDYFGIDDKVVWQIIKTKISDLKEFLSKYLNPYDYSIDYKEQHEWLTLENLSTSCHRLAVTSNKK